MVDALYYMHRTLTLTNEPIYDLIHFGNKREHQHDVNQSLDTLRHVR